MSIYDYWAKTNYNDAVGSEFKIHLVPYHNLDVAACLKYLLELDQDFTQKMCTFLDVDTDDFTQGFVFLAALHDIGKFGVPFQAKSSEALEKLGIVPYEAGKEKLHHSSMGLALLEGILPTKGLNTYCALNIPINWLRLVLAHHGYPAGTGWCGPQDGYRDWDSAKLNVDTFCRAKDHNRFEHIQDTVAYIRQCKDLFNFESITFSEVESYLTWPLAGRMVEADWLGSGLSSKLMIQKKVPLQDYWDSIQDKAREQVLKSGLISKRPLSVPLKKQGFQTLYGSKGYEPRPSQEWSNNVTLKESGLIILEDLTGSGKTEAALTLAHRFISKGWANGIYMGMPTQTSSNQIAPRLVSFVRHSFPKGSDVQFGASIHGNMKNSRLTSQILKKMTSSVEDEDTLKAIEDSHLGLQDWLSHKASRAFLSQIGVGTIDQLLLSTLPKYHQAMRLRSVFNKVVIIDEIHAYEEYQKGLLESFLRWASATKVPVILLSATLPKDYQKSLILAYTKQHKGKSDLKDDYPLCTYAYSSGLEQTNPYDVSNSLDEKDILVTACSDIKSVVEKIKSRANQGQCVCWFRNTVKEAQQAYDMLKKCSPELAHARFISEHRIENDAYAEKMFGPDSDKSTRSGKIVIATQVYEQSLDLDFDFMVSDLAPIDLLVQRFGRLVRHNRNLKKMLDPEACDPRKDSIEAWVYMPSFTYTPSKTWYSKVFESAKYVYFDVPKLWLTAKQVVEKKCWRLPEDSRALIENVYGSGLTIPPKLEERKSQAFFREMSDKMQAKGNRLSLSSEPYGSKKDFSRWSSDDILETRLSRYPTRSFRLGVVRDGKIEPFGSSWEKSSISLAIYQLFEGYIPAQLRDQAEEIKDSWGKARKWEHLALVIDDKVRGQALAGRKKLRPVTLSYSRKRGLRPLV